MPRRPFARVRTAHPAGGDGPAVSIVMAVYDPPHDALVGQLEAIAGQTSTDWECIVVDDASTDPVIVALLDDWATLGLRRQVLHRADNGGIAAATNDGLDAAVGRYVTICDHDDVIEPDAVAAIVDHFAAHPDHDVVYTDEQLVDADGNVVAGYPKPDYGPIRHLGHHYLAHLVAARRSALGDLRVSRQFEPAQDYDFWLRVIERSTRAGRGVGHISRMLYSWRAITGSSALDASEKPEMCDAVRRCVQAALDRRGIDRRAVTVSHEGRPTTSVMLEPVDGASPSVELIEYSADTGTEHVNAAARASDADVLCFTPPGADVDATWARPLALEAVQPGVGVVGPKIVTTDGRLGSIGRTIAPSLADPFAGEPADSSGPWGAFFVVREVSAVAPAGLTIARDLFERVGGFGVDVSLDVAAAELCVECEAAGRSTIVHPGTALVHDLADVAGDPFGLARDLAVARTRQAQRWTERFHVSGPSHLVWSEPNAYGRLLELLAGDRIDLVTFDVFDTVVTRAVATPSDLFAVLADHVDLPAHVTPAVFAAGRRSAERRARHDRAAARRLEMLAVDPDIGEDHLITDPVIAAPEVTLDQIWALVPDDWGDRANMMAAELALESETLTPIPEAIEVFGWARRADVPVVLVSDIYLTGHQLSTMLAAAGVDMGLVDDVVTSADHAMGKAHGLLAHVVADRCVPPERVAHVGDNEHADIDTAVRLGAHPVHVDIPRSDRHVEFPSAPVAAWSSAVGTDLGITAAVRSELVGAGRLGRDPAYQYGAAVVGPTLAGFGRWVATTATSLGASHVHCLLREGATIADLLAVTSPDGPAPVPVHVSRWVTMRAAVTDGTAEQLVASLARRADLTVGHVVAAFGCDADRVRDVLGGESVEPGRIVEACVALSNDEAIRARIVESAAGLRRRVLTYLRSRLVLIDGEPLVVADVGWGGTIQEGLTRILRSDGIECETVGLYLALSSAGEERIARGARMLSYLPNATVDRDAAADSRTVAHHADTLERIMTPAIGTLIDIDESGEPVCRPVGHDPIPPSLRAAQDAMRRVVERLAGRCAHDDGPGGITDERWMDPSLRAAFARTIADVVTAPSRPLAEVLGAWPHDDVAGEMSRSIAGADLAELVPFSTIRDVDVLDPTGRKWVAGSAAVLNPALSAQIAAARAGVSIDGLSPMGENGIARLVTFDVGSESAALQRRHAPGVLPPGWSWIRLTGEVDSLRSLRFESGDDAALVEVAHFSVRLTTTRPLGSQVLYVGLTDPGVSFVDARRIDTRRFAHRRGGHLVLDIDTDLAPDVRSVDAVVAFRCWRLDDDAIVRAPVSRRLADGARRIVLAARRRR